MDLNNLYILGDLHFGDKGIIEICNRPFKNVREMEKSLTNNWNTVIQDDNLVIVNGDFTFGTECSLSDMKRILKNLNGTKYLIRGNHDTYSREEYLSSGFEDVIDFPIILNNFYIVSHEPLFMPKSGPYVNIYAHVHNNPNYNDISSRGFCTSCERDTIDYTPIKYTRIKEIILLKNERITQINEK